MFPVDVDIRRAFRPTFYLLSPDARGRAAQVGG